MEELLGIGFIIMVVGAIFAEIAFIASSGRITSLKLKCLEGYDIVIKSPDEFLNLVNNSNIASIHPAFYQDNNLYIKGIKENHLITWDEEKVYVDYEYAAKSGIPLGWSLRTLNFFRSFGFPKQIARLYDAVSVMENVAKIYDPKYEVDEKLLKNKKTYDYRVLIWFMIAIVGMVITIIGAVEYVNEQNSSSSYSDKSINQYDEQNIENYDYEGDYEGDYEDY